MSVNPITPQEAIELRTDNIPDFVFEAFNQLLVKHLNGDRAIIKQDAIIEKIIELSQRDYLSASEIYANKWLDIESAYAEFGWVVDYHKASYGEESFEPYFVFAVKLKN